MAKSAKNYDVVIIGGGNGGVVAGCRAALMGLKALVIEKHNMIGGAATSFVRGRFEFEASLHELQEYGTGEPVGQLRRLFQDLGVELECIELPDAFRLVVSDGVTKSMDVTIPHGREKFFAYMEEQCPGCTPSIEAVFKAAEEINRAMPYIGMSRGKPDPEVLKRDYPEYCRLSTLSAGDAFKLFGMPQKCIDIFSAYWPYQGSDIYTIDCTRYFLMEYGYFLNGAYLPKMRSHELANNVEKRARELGCEFWTETEVSKILTKNGAVCGVETADGRRVEATAVIANCFPEVAYGKLLDNKSLVPKYEKQKINARSYGFRGLSVYLGLDATAEELGIKDYNIFLAPSVDTVELFNQCKSRDTITSLSCTCQNVPIPDATPAGTCMMSLTGSFTAEAWNDVTEETYAKEKSKFADRMIDYYEKAMGVDLRSHIEEIAIATPVTFARYLGTPQGSIYGYHASEWDGTSTRNLIGAMEPTIPGLFFCGAHANNCSGFFPTLSSGNVAAMQAMGYVMGGGKR